MNPDLFLAILAMDSYNRGYDRGIKGISDTAPIGNATFFSMSDTRLGFAARNAGFFGIAYDWDGKRVISYRGTDGANDVWHGWTLGAGYTGADQAGLAMDFYQAASPSQGSIYGPADPNVILTGHSLG